MSIEADIHFFAVADLSKYSSFIQSISTILHDNHYQEKLTNNSQFTGGLSPVCWWWQFCSWGHCSVCPSYPEGTWNGVYSVFLDWL